MTPHEGQLVAQVCTPKFAVHHALRYCLRDHAGQPVRCNEFAQLSSPHRGAR